MTAPLEAFIARWQGREGGQERANYAMFLSELCNVLGVRRPDPATVSTAENNYVFERVVKRQALDGSPGAGRIDLYKRNCFVLEAKQSRQAGGTKEIATPSLPGTADEVREQFPEVYQYLKMEVKEKILSKSDGKREFIGRDWNNRESYRELWWIFGEPRGDLRPALHGLRRYVVTPVTPKHRVFAFLDGEIMPDDALMCFASDDAHHLGVLQSKINGRWVTSNAASIGGYIGDVRYIKSRCFDPFPFPDANDAQKQRIRVIAEDLDAHRKRVLAERPQLTLTGLYNLLEKLRVGTRPDALVASDRRIFDDGLVLILKEYHDRLDTEVAAPYGWPADLSDNELLARLVALNQERVREEAAGHVRWLRPDYQIPRFGSTKDKLALTGGAMHEPAAAASGPKPSFPSSELEQTAAVLSVLSSVTEPASATTLAVRFRQGRRILPQVEAVLAALVRVGGLVTTPDSGRSFLPGRAA